MGDLLKLGYAVEDYFPEDVVNSEKRADEPKTMEEVLVFTFLDGPSKGDYFILKGVATPSQTQP